MNENLDILEGKDNGLIMGEKSTFAVRVLKDGRITIPEDQREKLKINVGDWVKLVMEKLEE
ncbi:MAG: hypothetical protein O8C67_15740 [Candidatus Methanoperedens sp.]|nr:hypothetical protein [Candidatus Methanoperedens sp.]